MFRPIIKFKIQIHPILKVLLVYKFYQLNIIPIFSFLPLLSWENDLDISVSFWQTLRHKPCYLFDFVESAKKQMCHKMSWLTGRVSFGFVFLFSFHEFLSQLLFLLVLYCNLLLYLTSSPFEFQGQAITHFVLVASYNLIRF